MKFIEQKYLFKDSINKWIRPGLIKIPYAGYSKFLYCVKLESTYAAAQLYLFSTEPAPSKIVHIFGDLISYFKFHISSQLVHLIFFLLTQQTHLIFFISLVYYYYYYFVFCRPVWKFIFIFLTHGPGTGKEL